MQQYRKYSLWAVVVLLLALVVAMSARAGDTDDYAVSVKIGETYVLYYGTVSMVLDSIGNHYTQAMHIQELTQGNAYIWALTSNPNTGTEDVDVTAQYSMDGTTWLAGSGIDGLTQMGATSVADTVNIITAVRQAAYAPAKWTRILFDGQTGNTKCVVSWWMLFRKGEPFRGSGGDRSWYGVQNVTN